jgi:hypothetical protein
LLHPLAPQTKKSNLGSARSDGATKRKSSIGDETAM